MTDRLIKLYFSTVKILAQRPTHISAVATVLLIATAYIIIHNNNNTYKTR